MVYRVTNPLPLAARLRAIAREEGARAALGRVATYGRLKLAGSRVGQAVGFGAATPSSFSLGPIWADLAVRGSFFGARPVPDAVQPAHLAILAEAGLPQCTRYRVGQMAALAARLGVACTLANHRDEDEAVTALQMASHVMLYRMSPSPKTWMYLYEARRLGLPVLYDLDDPLHSVLAISAGAAHLPDALRRHFADQAPGFLAMMAAADAITVSTDTMAEAVRAFLPRPVYVRRNYADDEMLAPLPEMPPAVPGGPGLTLACASGSEGRLGDLAPILPVLERFLDADPTRRMIFIGRGFDGYAGLPARLSDQISLAPFQEHPLYLRQLAAADVVLVPLADDPFNACKSAVRALDAAAAGRPVIASDIGDNRALVVPGQTGWLARTPADWARALDAAAALPDRGAAMGRAARAGLRERWSDPTDPSITDPALRDWLVR